MIKNCYLTNQSINLTLIFPIGWLGAPLSLTSTIPGHWTLYRFITGEKISEDYEETIKHFLNKLDNSPNKLWKQTIIIRKIWN